MLENFLHGRRKHVWISVGNDLAFDARRDLDDLGCGKPDEDDDDNRSEGEEEEEVDSDESSEEEEDEGEGEGEKKRSGGDAGRQRKVPSSSGRVRRGAAVAADAKLGNKNSEEPKKKSGGEKNARGKEEAGSGGGRGGVFIESFQQNKHAYGTIRDGDGVMFLTYSSLVAANRDGKSRLKQLLKWCGGKDFDGCILLDECHRAKNLYAAGGGAATKAGAAVVELQAKLPNARIVYCSATGASEPRNLGYMTRLGLWGAIGSPFPGGFKDFLTAVDGRGVGAMELVAMHLKQTGSFVCRTLSFSGCAFELVTDVLGEEMEETYNEAAAFWQELKRELARAQAEKAAFLSTPGILEEDLDLSSEEEEEDDPLGELDGMIDDSDTESVAARRRHRSLKGGFVWRYFWGSHQRFFRDLCIASKVPATIEQAQQALDNDKSTGEASTEAAMKSRGGGGGGGGGAGAGEGEDVGGGGASAAAAAATAAETTSTDYISAPRQTLMRVIERCFPLPPRPRAMKMQDKEDFRAEKDGWRDKRSCRAGKEKKGMYKEKSELDVPELEEEDADEEEEASASSSDSDEDSSVALDSDDDDDDDDDGDDDDGDSSCSDDDSDRCEE
ncbi:unnamed protein product [Ectocarpus sp. CCAP 1310/34]|nr:unnamed protein product [Ectocarpus sp. CCAP 1310/34]